jgi:hypothetical protein
LKVIGYSSERASRGVSAVYVPLGPLTVLLGANDTGKSTLLRGLHQNLSGRTDIDDDPNPPQDGGAIFAELTAQELDLLVPGGNDLGEVDWGLGGYDVDRSPDLTRPPSRSPTASADPRTWVRTLGAHSASPPSFKAVLDAVRGSRLVCFEPVNQFGQQRRFLAYWCLPPIATLDPEIRRALEESELERFARQRSRTEGQGTFARGARFFFGGVDYLHAADAPVIVAPLAWNNRVMPPEVLITPSSLDDIRRAVAQSVAEVVSSVRHAESDYVQEPEWSRELEQERAAPRVFLRSEQGRWRVDPVAVGTLTLLRAEAQRLLPDFVASRYEIVLSFRPIDRWFDAAPIDFALQPHGSQSRRFAPEDLADGFHLWLQLAFAGALSAIDSLRAQLQTLAEQAGMQYLQAVSDGTPDEFDDDGRTMLHAAVASVERAGGEADPALPSPFGPPS